MRNTTIALLLLLAISRLYGQSDSDSLYKKILLVPYNPQMYISDSEQEIARVSKRELSELRKRFRLGLDLSLQSVFLTGYDSHSLLRDTTTAAQEEIEEIYRYSKFQYDVPMRIVQQLELEDAQPAYKTIFKKKKTPETKPEMGLEPPSEKEDDRIRDKDKYLNIYLTRSDIIPNLAEKYEVDLFVFVNQLEIQTDFTDCIDMQNQIYNRKIRVHYSMFNAQGVQVAGDVVETLFPSNINEAEEIIGRRFPELSHILFRQIPEKKDIP